MSLSEPYSLLILWVLLNEYALVLRKEPAELALVQQAEKGDVDGLDVMSS